MDRLSTASTKAARLLLVALFATNLYRAATQSITAAEAQAWERHVYSPLQSIMLSFDLNSQFLNVLLARISTGLFGLDEFTLRLPAVLAGGLFLWAAYRVVRRLAGEGLPLLVGVAAVTCNPAVLDHLSLALGNSMGLAFSMLAVDHMLAFLTSGGVLGPNRALLNRAGVMIALAVAGSFSFAFPCLAFSVAFVILCARRGEGWEALERMVATAAVVAMLLLALPLSHFTLDHLDTGARSVRAMATSLTDASLFPTRLLLIKNPLRVDAFANWARGAARIGLWVLPALGLLLASRAAKERAYSTRTPVFLLSGAMLLSLVLHVAARRFVAAPYPVTSTGIYLIPFFTLIALGLVQLASWQWMRLAGTLAVALVGAHYLGQFQVGRYHEWRHEQNSRKLAFTLAEAAGRYRVRIGASAGESSVINFYRAEFKQYNWLPASHAPIPGKFDVYVLNESDYHLIADLNLRTIYMGGGLALAAPRR